MASVLSSSTLILHRNSAFSWAWDCLEVLSLSTSFFLALASFLMIVHLSDIMVSQLCRHITTLIPLSHVNMADLEFFLALWKFWRELSLRVLELFWRCFQCAVNHNHCLVLLVLFGESSESIFPRWILSVFLQWLPRVPSPCHDLHTSLKPIFAYLELWHLTYCRLIHLTDI